MFTHNLKIALRNLFKNKVQSVITIIGLSVGLLGITVALIWVRYETTFDSSYPDAGNIHKILRVYKNHESSYAGNCYGAVGGKLYAKYPEVEAVTVITTYDITITKDDINVNNLKADSNFFKVFDIPFLIGDKKTALKHHNSIILTESAAIRLYGNVESAMGKTLNAHSQLSDVIPQYTVNGIIRDIKHTQFNFESITPISQSDVEQYDTDSNDHFEVYVLLKDHIDKKLFYEKIASDSDIFIQSWEKSYFNNYLAVPLSQVFYKYGLKNNADITFPYSYMLIIIAIALLLFICTLFNHSALYISLVYNRLKNLGLRKSLGSSNKQLISLQLTEFLIYLVIAFFLSFCLIEIIRPVLESRLSITVYPYLLLCVIFIVLALSIIISLSLIIYPVWFICTKGIKQSITGKKSAKQQITQKILITIQLVISVYFIFITAVMYLQLHYIHTKERGIDIKNVLSISGLIINNKELIINDLLNNPDIIKVTKDVLRIFDEKGHQTAFEEIHWQGDESIDKSSINFVSVDYSFTDFFNIPLTEGRSFVYSPSEERSKMLISHKVANMFTVNPIGKIITYNSIPYEVIGIIEDFNIRSFKYEPQAVILSYFNMGTTGLFIKFLPGRQNEAINHIKEVYKKHSIEYQSIESLENVLKSYNKTDTVMMQTVTIIAVICTLISIFGVYSLTLFTMERRRREVSIRKVMGASVGDIIGMFIKQYLYLIALACIIALPPAYFTIEKWLRTYANRIKIEWWVIAGIIFTVITIVILTVIRQIIKTANTNPAEVIKYE